MMLGSDITFLTCITGDRCWSLLGSETRQTIRYATPNVAKSYQHVSWRKLTGMKLFKSQYNLVNIIL